MSCLLYILDYKYIITIYVERSLGRSNKGDRGRQGMWHAWERGEKVNKVWVGKPEGKRPFERSRRRWKNGIRMHLREFGWGCVSGVVHLAEDRHRWRALMNAIMNLLVLVPRI
jgi:hypothetical protein